MVESSAWKGHLSCEPELLRRFKALEAKQQIAQAKIALSAKRGRGYQRVMTGMEKAVKLNVPLYRLDLTLKDYDQPKTSQFLQTLRKRIARHYRINLNYLSIKAKGSKGGKIHLHLVYWVSTLNGKPVYELRRAWINKYWLSWNWNDITGSKITFIQTVKGGLTSRKKVSNYLIGQYFSGQNHYERMSYSRAWIFKGSCTIWKSYFAPHYSTDPSTTLDAWMQVVLNSIDSCSALEFISNSPQLCSIFGG